MEPVDATKKTKVHSLIDKIYSQSNLKVAWEKVRANRGAGGIDRVSITDFDAVAEEELAKLHEELKNQTYQPMPVRRVEIPKPGKAGEKRPLGIPAIRDRVCQQALKNRLEPIFEVEFNDCSFGYRPGRSPHDAMREIWKGLMEGHQWILDADLRDYFGSVDHEKLIDMIAERVSDGRVLKLIRQMLKTGYMQRGRLFPTEQGTPQGGVSSPLFSNIYLTPFDNEMTGRGHRLTRFADDWVVLCRSKKEAEKALTDARTILESLGLTLHPSKTRIVHIRQGFEFLGYKLQQGKGLKLPEGKIKKGKNVRNIYAIPTGKSVKRFMEKIRDRTKRKIPLKLQEIIEWINPVIRGWGNYYRKAHVRKLFNRLRAWIIHRLWAHQYKRWRNIGWRKYPESKLYGQYGLVNLIRLIPDIGSRAWQKQ